MKTGSFRTFKGPGAVSIARSARGFRGPSYRALAPGSWFKSVSKIEYERRFSEQLARLDPDQVKKELNELTHPFEPVLMCWEVPPFDDQENWCHRRMVAEWFASTLAIEVAEFRPGMELKLYEDEDTIHAVVFAQMLMGKW